MTTPDDAVRKLWAEIERLRAELAEAQARIAWLSGDQTYHPVPGERMPQGTNSPDASWWREDNLEFGDDKDRDA